jgi:molecular chaperone GrpE
MDTPITPENELEAPEEQELLEPQESANDLERERDEYKEGWMRAKADFTNYKRTEAERINTAITMGMKSIVEDLLLVLDSFGLALQALKDNPVGEQGMRMIQGQLHDVLKRYGVELIKPEELIGKEFDPAVAEAIGFKNDSVHAEGTIDSVMQDGYRMNGKVLRPTRVYLAGPKTS